MNLENRKKSIELVEKILHNVLKLHKDAIYDFIGKDTKAFNKIFNFLRNCIVFMRDGKNNPNYANFSSYFPEKIDKEIVEHLFHTNEKNMEYILKSALKKFK